MSSAPAAEWLRAWDTLVTMKPMEAGGRVFSLHGRVVKGVGHLGHDEAMEAGGREFSLHGRVVKGVGHLLAVMKLWRREVVCSAPTAEWLRAWDTLAMMKLWRREVMSSSPDRGTILG